jgi:hypothetical protein
MRCCFHSFKDLLSLPTGFPFLPQSPASTPFHLPGNSPPTPKTLSPFFQRSAKVRGFIKSSKTFCCFSPISSQKTADCILKNFQIFNADGKDTMTILITKFLLFFFSTPDPPLLHLSGVVWSVIRKELFFSETHPDHSCHSPLSLRFSPSIQHISNSFISNRVAKISS